MTTAFRDLPAQKQAALAALLARRRDDTITTLPRDGRPLPCSAEQRRLWLVCQVDPDRVVNVSSGLRLRGPLQEDALRAAVHAHIGRHEILRTTFTEIDGEPFQRVSAAADPAALHVVDLPGASEERLREASAAVLDERFDLEGGPLFRAHLFRLAPDDHVLLLVWHHIVADGLSAGNAFGEIVRLYRGEALPGLPVQYADYAAWSRDRLTPQAREERLRYWAEQAAGTRTELPHGSPPAGDDSGAETVRTVPAALVEGLKAAGGPRTTTYLAFLTAYKILLSRYTGQGGVTVGTVSGGRGRRELEPLIGCFLNMLALHTDLPGELTFAEALHRTRTAVAGAFANELPFEEVVARLEPGRSLRSSPLFESAVIVQHAYARIEPWPGIDAEWWGHLPQGSAFDLALMVREKDTDVELCFRYRRDRFEDAAVTRLADHFLVLLESIAADPGTVIAEHRLLTPAERVQVLETWNDTGEAAPPWRLLHEVTAGAPPQAPAIVRGDQVLTYGELERRSEVLARRLRRHGVGRDTVTAIDLEPSPGQAVAILAILRAGGAYLPLDPEQPPARLAALLADSGAVALVTSADLPRPPFDGAVLTLDEAPEPDLPPLDPDAIDPGDLAYVIYTSGSTGQPKGVAVQHRQILNYLAGVRERFAIVPGSTYGLPQSLAFDFGMTMLYLALATGGCVHLLPKHASGAELAGHGLDYLKLTPSHLAALGEDTDVRTLLPARALIVGGEASRTDWLRDLARHCEIFNHYGPTEATVGATTWKVSQDGPAGTTAPIGRPLPGARAYVLDSRLEPVPVGVTGELHLGGDRLARGYLGRPDLTAERFLDTPYGRLYRTGDLARWLPDGNLEFLGRRDDQIKIRGFRVELGEVEASLAACPGVARAAAAFRDGRLIGYVTGEREIPAATLRAFLTERTADHLVPNRFVWLDRFPMQAHGKVDRKRLPDPQPETQQYLPPATPAEEAIAAVWATLLNHDRVGALDDFFDLGGHSLLALQAVARIRKALPAGCRPVSMVDLFQHPTVRDLAARAEHSGPASLLYELTSCRAPALSLVCLPYGGAGATVYQPLADALPAGHALYAVEPPGHDIGLGGQALPLPELAAACVGEILERVSGPLVLYGHCGPGGALAVEIARQLEAAGRDLQAVHLGGIFPFALPSGRILGPLYRRFRWERLRSDAVYGTWLQSIGADVGALDATERAFMIKVMREDGERAEEYFTRLLEEGSAPLRAPIVSIVGERDPGTEYYRERYREWGSLTGDRTALVVIDEAGHYFLKYRAEELAQILTTPLPAAAPPRPPKSTWWLDRVSTAGEPVASGPQPGMGRFLAVAAGQLTSMVGSSLTEFALPLWVYLRTGSLLQFTLFALVGLVPGLLISPFLGAIVDRGSKRGLLLLSGGAAGGLQAVILLLLVNDRLTPLPLYALLSMLSVTAAVQRLAYVSAVPQLIPKAYLGHANGVVQLTLGLSRFVVPVAAVGLLAGIGMSGILVLDVVSYALATVVLLIVRFPRTMAWSPRETMAQAVREGFHYLWRRRGLRAMVRYFFVLNFFLSTVFVMISPLALSAGTLGDAGRLAMVSGLGFTLGGLAMAVWGGPTRSRMTAMLTGCLLLSGFAVIAGFRATLLVIAVGIFGMSVLMAVVDGIWTTIIHTKVPHRFHARVIAVNQLIAMSTQPLGFALIAPLAPGLLNPLLRPDGALSGTVGVLIGVGPSRGIGLLYVLCGLAMAAWTLVNLRHPALATFDQNTPDAEPDDLIGLAAVTRPPA